ncbi:NAD-binding protein, partial [Kaarinaea lacus]
MANIIVLGAGRIGKAIAIDLAKNHQVAAIDYDSYTLEQLTQENTS